MKTTLRQRADAVKPFRCKNLIAVLENPKTIENVGSAIRNADAFGVEKIYVIDRHKLLPDKWEDMRERRSLNKISASAIKWKYTKVFRDTKSCIDYLKKNNFKSIVTSPHIKGRKNTILEDGVYTDKKLAVWFGNESHGISEEAVEASKLCVNLPMCGIIESINLGTCTGIVLYEISKQRRNYDKKRH